MGIKEQLLEFETKISEGLKRSFEKMLVMKREKNSPVIIIRKGRIEAVKADDLADEANVILS